jgi:hypothetical protein
MEHAIARVETELRWHDAVEHRVGKLAADAATPSETAPGTTAHGTGAGRAGADRVQ